MSDHLFPRYHVRPPSGYVNDPNGPLVVDGVAHLYFQYRFGLDLDAPVHWGHVTSTDLAHWDHHAPALAPHASMGDRDGCWSGNTVLDPSGAVRAFYSGHRSGSPLQRTLSAVSADGGFSFGPPRSLLPDPPAAEGIRALRDPFVWREGASWWMIIGAGTSTGTAMVRLHESDDLQTWRYHGPLATMARTRTAAWDSGAMWECPQILRFGPRTVVVVGSWGPTEGIMNVLSFARPDPATGPGIQPSAVHLVDDGPNFYAASVMGHSIHGPIMWGWVTEGRSLEWCRDDDWSGMLSLPRTVSLRADGALASAPLPALASLRVDPVGQHVSDRLDDVGAQFEFLLRGCDRAEAPYELLLRFGSQEHLRIIVDPSDGTVTIDRDQASSDDRAQGGRYTIVAPEAEGLSALGEGIRGFVDGSILELFLPGGRVATTRFYPSTPPPWQIELVGTAGPAHITIWELTGLDPRR